MKKKVQEVFKQHGEWFRIFRVCLIIWAVMAAFAVGIVSASPEDKYDETFTNHLTQL